MDLHFPDDPSRPALTAEQSAQMNKRLVRELERIGEWGHAEGVRELGDEAAPHAYTCLAGDRVDVAHPRIVEDGYTRGMLA